MTRLTLAIVTDYWGARWYRVKGIKGLVYPSLRQALIAWKLRGTK